MKFIKIEFSKLLKDKYFKQILIIFIIYKVVIISVAILSVYLIPAELTMRKVTTGTFLDAFAQLDARAYLDIAKNGYNKEFNGISNYGWYPFYPLLIRIFSFLGYELAAFLISNLFSFLAVLFLYILVKEELNRKKAKKTIFYLLFFPSAFFLTMMYTESLFLFLSITMFFFAKRNKWLLVGILGFCASLTRIQGILLFIPMLYIYLSKRNFNIKKIGLDSFYLILIPLGLITLLLYHYVITGDAFIQFYTQGKFSRQISWPWTSFLSTFQGMLNSNIIGISYDIFNLVMTISLIFLLYLSYKFLRKEYTLYYALSILLPLTSANLASMSRFVLLIFPVFISFAILSENRKYDRILKIFYILFIIILIISTVRFANEDLKFTEIIKF